MVSVVIASHEYTLECLEERDKKGFVLHIYLVPFKHPLTLASKLLHLDILLSLQSTPDIRSLLYNIKVRMRMVGGKC